MSKQKIGIGTANPMSILHIVNEGKECFRIQEDGDCSGDVNAAIEVCKDDAHGWGASQLVPYLRAIKRLEDERDEREEAAR